MNTGPLALPVPSVALASPATTAQPPTPRPRAPWEIAPSRETADPASDRATLAPAVRTSDSVVSFSDNGRRRTSRERITATRAAGVAAGQPGACDLAVGDLLASRLVGLARRSGNGAWVTANATFGRLIASRPALAAHLAHPIVGAYGGEAEPDLETLAGLRIERLPVATDGGEWVLLLPGGEPTATEAAPTPQRAGAAAVHPAGSPSTPSNEPGLPMLLVEDDSLQRIVATTALRSVGFDVVAVDTLAGARYACKTARYAAVVSDVELPDGSGAALVLDEDPEQAGGPPLLLLSAQPPEPSLLAASRAQGWLAKPLDVVAVCHALATSPGPAAAAASSIRRRWLDETEALDRLEGDHCLYRDLLAEFRRRYTHVLDTVDAEARAGNVAAVHTLLHRLRGAALNLGAHPLAEELARLEPLTDPADPGRWLRRLAGPCRALTATLAAVEVVLTEAEPLAGART